MPSSHGNASTSITAFLSVCKRIYKDPSLAFRGGEESNAVANGYIRIGATPATVIAYALIYEVNPMRIFPGYVFHAGKEVCLIFDAEAV